MFSIRSSVILDGTQSGVMGPQKEGVVGFKHCNYSALSPDVDQAGGIGVFANICKGQYSMWT